jgi:hypothetical protein
MLINAQEVLMQTPLNQPVAQLVQKAIIVINITYSQLFVLKDITAHQELIVPHLVQRVPLEDLLE